MNRDNIKLVRLVRGDEILAEVEKEDNGVRIKNPLRVVMIPGKSTPNSPTVGLAPWMEFSADESFFLDNQHVLVIATPIKEFINQYSEAFSKIITPTSSLILPTS